MPEMRRMLRQGGVIGLLVDQSRRAEGVEVNFFLVTKSLPHRRLPFWRSGAKARCCRSFTFGMTVDG